MPSMHDFTMSSISGEPVDLADFEGRVCLVVNVASECGLTPQYEGLRTLHQQNRDNGFAVLGFPCNQFGAQEPGTDAQICEFAQTKYGVDFPMFAKIEVNGEGACDLYEFLKSAAPGGDGKAEIAWNFTKFLVDGKGNVIKRYDPMVTPEEIAADLPQYLG